MIDNDSFPIDGALIGGYVETFGLSHYLGCSGVPTGMPKTVEKRSVGARAWRLNIIAVACLRPRFPGGWWRGGSVTRNIIASSRACHAGTESTHHELERQLPVEMWT